MSTAQKSAVDEEHEKKRGEKAAADQINQVRGRDQSEGDEREKGKITAATEKLQKDKQGHSGLVASVFDAAKGAYSTVVGNQDKNAACSDNTSIATSRAMTYAQEEEERAKPGSNAVLEGTEEQGRRAMEERRLREFREASSVTGGGDDIGPEAEAQVRAQAAQEAAALRGISAKENIMGAKKSWGETIRSKLTMPTDIVEETLAARRHSGTGRATEAEKDEVSEVKMETEENPVGVVDSIKLKASHRNM